MTTLVRLHQCPYRFHMPLGPQPHPQPQLPDLCNGDTALGDQQPHGDPTHPAEERPQLVGSGPVSLVTFRVVSPISLHHPTTSTSVSHLSVGHRLSTVSHLAFQCCSLPPEDNPHPHMIAHSTSPHWAAVKEQVYAMTTLVRLHQCPRRHANAPWPATPPPTPAP
jgi:hypothetical protein